MADGGFDVLIRFITELVGENAVKSTTDSLEDLRKKVEASNQNLSEQQKILKIAKTNLAAMTAELKKLTKQFKDYEIFSEEAKQRLAEQNPEYKRYVDLKTAVQAANQELVNQKQVVDQAKESHKNLTQQLQKEEEAQKGAQSAAMKTSATLSRVSSTLQGISNTLVVGGTAVAGGLFKIAKDFIDSVEEDTELTREWKRATDSLKDSYKAVGQVAASEILPFLKEAAVIADKIAGFAQQNPGAIGAAVQVGVIALAIGVLGKAVASGIKLVADVTYIAASATNLASSANMLLASAGMNTAAGLFSTTVGVILIPALIIFAGVLSGILVGLMAYEAIAQSSGGKIPDLETLGTQGGLIIKTKVQELFDQFNRGLDTATVAVGKFGENTEKLLDIFSKMREDLAEEESRYQASRMKIISSSNAAMERAASSSASKIRSINERAAANRTSIISNFVKSSAEDVRRFESERARIIRDGGLEIARIEQERLEKQRQLEMDHSDRVDELVANRDALGLVLEQRKFDRERAEIDRNTNKEIAQRRQDLAIRLQDLAQNFAAERAQKQAQFQQDLKDNEAKRQEEIKAERAHLVEQTREIQKNRANQLRELALQHAEEMRRIRESTIAKIRDLDASLLGEQQKKRQYQALMLQDLDRFLAEYRRRMAGGFGSSTVRGTAGGGYVNNELIQTHGVEFVTSASTTRALERLIGGRLNQQNLVAAVAGVGNNVTWNDQRRFDGTYNKNMKRQVENDTIDTIRKAFEK